MKIVRYQTATGQTAYGRLHADGRTTRLAGEIFGELTDTGGTPHGVGGARKPPVFLQPGDTVTIQIDGIGTLTNPVIAEGANG